MADPQATMPDLDTVLTFQIDSVPTAGPFAFDFTFYKLDEDVKVEIDFVLQDPSTYTVTGNTGTEDGFMGGEVTLNDPVSNVQVTIYRLMKVERVVNFPLAGEFSVAALNTTLNIITGWVQELWAKMGTKIGFARGDGPPDGNVILPPPEPGQVIGYDRDGNLDNITPDIPLYAPVNEKGEIYSHDGVTGAAVPAPPSDGLVLVADQAETTGLKWATPTYGGGLIGVGRWIYRGVPTGGEVAGEFRANTAPADGVNLSLRFHKLDIDGDDISAFLTNAAIGGSIYLQQRDNAEDAIRGFVASSVADGPNHVVINMEGVLVSGTIDPGETFAVVLETGAVAGQRGGGMIVGQISPWPTATPPAGTVLANGQALDSIANTGYAALFDLIGTTFGGTGASNFNVPDIDGRTVVGVGTAAGQASPKAWTLAELYGVNKHALTEAELASHAHTGRITPPGARGHDQPGGNFWGSGAFLQETPDLGVEIDPAGSGQPHENVQPSIGLYWVICYDEALASGSNVPDILTASGDLLTHDGTQYVRLPRGADGQVLGTVGTGIQWVNQSGGPGGPGDVVQNPATGAGGNDNIITYWSDFAGKEVDARDDQKPPNSPFLTYPSYSDEEHITLDDGYLDYRNIMTKTDWQTKTGKMIFDQSRGRGSEGSATVTEWKHRIGRVELSFHPDWGNQQSPSDNRVLLTIEENDTPSLLNTVSWRFVDNQGNYGSDRGMALIRRGQGDAVLTGSMVLGVTSFDDYAANFPWGSQNGCLRLTNDFYLDGDFYRWDGVSAYELVNLDAQGTVRDISDDGIGIVIDGVQLNFTGAGVAVSDGGNGRADINIPGGAVGGGISKGSPFAVGDLMIVASDAGDGQANTLAAGLGADEVRTHLDVVAGNPHGTTAADVGADPAGSAAAVQTNLDTHEGQVNPHGLTAADINALTAIVEDTTPQFGGEVHTNNFEIILEAADQSTEVAAIGTLTDDSGAYFAKILDGLAYDPTDGAVVARGDGVELHGTQVEVVALTHSGASGKQVYTSPGGLLYAVDPPDVLWQVSDTDTSGAGAYTLGTGAGTGSWIEMTGLAPTTGAGQDITTGDPLLAEALVWVENAGNQSGDLEFWFDTPGEAPGTPDSVVTISRQFAGYVPVSLSVNADQDWPQPQAFTLYVRRNNGTGGNYTPVLDGSVNEHSMTVTARTSTAAPGGGDVVAGAPFTDTHVLAVQSAAGKVIQSVGFPASAIARLDQANTFSEILTISGSGNIGVEMRSSDGPVAFAMYPGDGVPDQRSYFFTATGGGFGISSIDDDGSNPISRFSIAHQTGEITAFGGMAIGSGEFVQQNIRLLHPQVKFYTGTTETLVAGDADSPVARFINGTGPIGISPPLDANAVDAEWSIHIDNAVTVNLVEGAGDGEWDKVWGTDPGGANRRACASQFADGTSVWIWVE